MQQIPNGMVAANKKLEPLARLRVRAGWLCSSCGQPNKEWSELCCNARCRLSRDVSGTTLPRLNGYAINWSCN